MKSPSLSIGWSFVEVYEKLYSAFGPQGWWPIVDEKTGVCEYDGTAPAHRDEAFEILIGCILMQNTQWDPNVVRAIGALKKMGKLDASILASSDHDVIAPLIKSAGYFNQKTDRIKRAASFWIENQDLFNLDIMDLREKLLAQRGIGNETADSIILYAAGKPSFVIDAYTRRVMARMGVCENDAGYEELQAMFHDAFETNLGPDANPNPSSDPDSRVLVYKEYHALLVELAKRHCKTKPVCSGCPLGDICEKRV